MFYVLSFQWHALVKVKADGEWQGTLSNKLGSQAHTNLTSQLNLRPGDLLMLAAGPYTDTVSNWQSGPTQSQ